MKVYGNFRQEVDINPQDVIEQLISKEIGSGGWIESGGSNINEPKKYYKCWEASAGQHSIDRNEEITKELYDYVVALQFVLKKLKE